MIDIVAIKGLNNLAIMFIIAYGIVFLYSLYMAYLAWKQAKVKNLMEETNKLLKSILEVLNGEQRR
jgi:meiotically up-regulated gene 157 (Mug157) protein